MYLNLKTLLSLLGAVVLIRLLINITKAVYNPLSSLPGPWYTKYTALILDFYWLRGKRAKYVEKLHRRYVDFCSITAARKIHGFRQYFQKGEMYRRITVIKDMESVFSTTDYNFHARHRRVLSAPLSESSLKIFESKVAEKAELAVQRIKEEMQTKGAADVMKWWLFMATDVIGELSFGDSFRMLDSGRKDQYVQDLERVSFLSGLRIAFPNLVQLSSYIPIPFIRGALAASHRMKNYAEQSLNRYRKLESDQPHHSIKTLFTKVYGAGEDGLSSSEIVANAQAYIIAGTDTTAISLTYLVWAVCKNKDVKQRLIDEMAQLPIEYTHDDLKAAPYLNQVIYETLRLYAAVPSALPREVPKGGSDVDGYWMPEGTTVCTQAYSLHRDSAMFTHPESFDPSRWENPRAEMKESWMPFGKGSRICLGLHLALMELRFATARFFRSIPKARVSTIEGFSDNDMEQVIYFLMSPKNKRCLIQMQ